MSKDVFTEEYNKLNKAQKEAVDTIDGPVMVVAGPGTGKTQILALRIGNILNKGVASPDSILCLTFTRSGVKAMRERLESYLGSTANDVHISTFHSFANDIVEKNYGLLGFTIMPKLLEDDEAVFLVDEIMQNNEWEHLRPRSNPAMYFNDLKQLISILKRERLSPEEFLTYVNEDIKSLTNDPDSISTRGESKGQLKKEVEKKIEALNRTLEVVEFYKLYEERKKEDGLMDYDDVLEYAVRLVEEYEDIRADIYENYLYLLVDEHQDSSGVQNNFLKAVWKDAEKPNIFVVGDDRQLIYAFIF
jgi:DNA helicase II / ATP-dependent DNA helicase PcrA